MINSFYRKIFGKSGENLAKAFLKKSKYKILEENYKVKGAEADIIAKDKDVLVFIEVKTRSNLNYGTPAQAVNKKKQEKYIYLAKLYLQEKNLFDEKVRFDVIEVLNGEINHIKDAFLEE